MKVINKKITLEKNLLEKIPDNSVFVDIETLGLNPKYNRIYLIGCLFIKNKTCNFFQILTQNQDDEKFLLNEFKKSIKNFENIITFNGENFDLPFITKRAQINGIEIEFSDKKNLDIFKLVKNRGYFLETKNRKLKTLEENIGIYREDKFSGLELIEKYLEYEEGNIELERDILLHNEEDIINLPYIIKYVDIINRQNFISAGNYEFLIEEIKIRKNNVLFISGTCNLKNAFYIEDLQILTVKNNNFEFKTPLKSAYYSENIKCKYIENQKLNLESEYEIYSPKEVFLIKYDKRILYKNIKKLFLDFIEKITQE